MKGWLDANAAWFFPLLMIAVLIPILVAGERGKWSFRRGMVVSLVAAVVVAFALITTVELIGG